MYEANCKVVQRIFTRYSNLEKIKNKNKKALRFFFNAPTINTAGKPMICQIFVAN